MEAMAATSETGRLFVAVWPPATVLDQIAGLPRSSTGLRWTTRDQWHVTQRFLGAAPLDPAIAALARLRDESVCAARFGGAAARLGRSAFVLPVLGLDALAAATARAFDGVGRPAEPRPFVGHVTLARLTGAGRIELPSLAVDASWTVQSVCLVRSHLGRGGARYETIAEVGLAVV